jgi:glucose/arabinose dehydrogenase
MPVRALVAVALLLAATPVAAQTIDDPTFGVETVVTGLALPTTMAFLGPDDALVLEKSTGRVRRVLAGALQTPPVLDVAVNFSGERAGDGAAEARHGPLLRRDVRLSTRPRERRRRVPRYSRLTPARHASAATAA